MEAEQHAAELTNKSQKKSKFAQKQMKMKTQQPKTCETL